MPLMIVKLHQDTDQHACMPSCYKEFGQRHPVVSCLHDIVMNCTRLAQGFADKTHMLRGHQQPYRHVDEIADAPASSKCYEPLHVFCAGC